MIELDKYSIQQALKAKGVEKIVADFSGGGDEGGIEGIGFFDSEGAKLEPFESTFVYVETSAWSEARQEYVTLERPQVSDRRQVAGVWQTTKRDATDDELLMAAIRGALHEPLEARWGSFAGEFTVHGQVIWDLSGRVNGGSIKLDYNESLPTYEHHQVDV